MGVNTARPVAGSQWLFLEIIRRRNTVSTIYAVSRTTVVYAGQTAGTLYIFSLFKYTWNALRQMPSTHWRHLELFQVEFCK